MAIVWARGDFAKIALPLWWEYNFEGAGPQKNMPESDSERHERKTSKKSASDAVCESICLVPGSFPVDFRVPRGFPQGAAESPVGRLRRSNSSDPWIIIL